MYYSNSSISFERLLSYLFISFLSSSSSAYLSHFLQILLLMRNSKHTSLRIFRSIFRMFRVARAKPLCLTPRNVNMSIFHLFSLIAFLSMLRVLSSCSFFPFRIACERSFRRFNHPSRSSIISLFLSLLPSRILSFVISDNMMQL
jgi:hypothetical protein